MGDADTPLDYARFGRQIALARVGAHGQRALAGACVAFVRAGSPAPSDREPARLAAAAHARAGGTVVSRDDGPSVCVELPLRVFHGAGARAAALAMGAWAAVEAARRVLGADAHASPPAALCERIAFDDPEDHDAR